MLPLRLFPNILGENLQYGSWQSCSWQGQQAWQRVWQQAQQAEQRPEDRALVPLALPDLDKLLDPLLLGSVVEDPILEDLHVLDRGGEAGDLTGLLGRCCLLGQLAHLFQTFLKLTFL